MKKNLVGIAFVAILFIGACRPDENKTEIISPDAHRIIYDSVKAKLYGADDYGMKKYVMAFLRKGPNRDLDSATSAALQKAHLENIFRMADEGLLVMAGPFFGKGELRGIYVFNVESLSKADSLTNTDPAIKAGSLEMDLLEWYGPAALMEVNELSKALTKSSILDTD